jgi:hypothetical protein
MSVPMRAYLTSIRFLVQPISVYELECAFQTASRTIVIALSISETTRNYLLYAIGAVGEVREVTHGP